ncbi:MULTISPECIES: VOC family protein [unclassified Streptomyces]|uniref:VOC family protein n=1 Tax=unclassified Streptomyces TaxID=2593676 RepID=UPI000F6DE4CE|nr:MULTISPECIES: VOC family protein [unclassified Streptomyces]AZM62399.1 glyoxalase [Streptomyces sp. WAC 01438]RSM93575.1 glyoxalase [Streptomyces sp. WAC 01420]HLV05602.1 VOC family protein [Actinomycetaceae bacterium]
MTSRFTELVVDCHDPERLAAFWCAVLDFEVIDRSEDKTVKNRLHLDVSPVDGSTDDEVARLLGLGAATVDVGQGPGRSWVVMADPEGNEFDVLRTLAPPGRAVDR